MTKSARSAATSPRPVRYGSRTADEHRRRRPSKTAIKGRSPLGLSAQRCGARPRRDHRVCRQLPRPHDDDRWFLEPTPTLAKTSDRSRPGFVEPFPFGAMADALRRRDQREHRRFSSSNRLQGRSGCDRCRRPDTSRRAGRSVATRNVLADGGRESSRASGEPGARFALRTRARPARHLHLGQGVGAADIVPLSAIVADRDVLDVHHAGFRMAARSAATRWRAPVGRESRRP